MNNLCVYLLQNTSFFVRSFLKTTIVFLFLFSAATFGQTSVTRIYTDWTAGGYWTSNGATGAGNRPDTENNLLGFAWNGTTYSTDVDDAKLTAHGVSFSAQKFRALKIQSLSHTGSTYFLQGSLIDGSATGRVLTPALASASSTPAELASRLTDGKNGLALGTGIANIATNSVYFKVGTNNMNVLGLNDGIPDLIVTQVAQPGGADVFKFVDASGTIVGNSVSVNFGSVSEVGSYSLDLFNASNGTIASSFSAQETRDIRILGYDTSAFGINSGNAAQVDRFVVTFSGSSDCAFIAFNANSLKKAELSLVKKATVMGCAAAGDVINYTFEVTNTGDVPMTDVTVTDPLSGLVISGTQGSTLTVGAMVTLTGTYTITAADVIAGNVTNSAQVTGIDPSLNTVVDISGQTNGDDIATVTYLSPGPTGNASQSFCSISSPTIANLTATGTAIKWYAAAIGGSALSTTAPLVNGTHYYASHTVGGCESRTRLDVTATVNNPVAPTGTASQIFCSISSPTAANLAATGTGIQWYAASSGGSPLAASTPLVNGTHYFASQTVSSCESISRFDVTATVRVTPSVPALGTITQPTCVVSTGSIVLSGLIVSQTLNQAGTVAASYPITSTTMTISGLAPGTYNFYASNGSCSSVSTGNVVISAVVTKTWTGSAWTPAGVPSVNEPAIIDGNYSASSNGDLNVCSLTINPSASLSVEADQFITIQNNLTVNGTLNILDKGSLVMVNDLGTVSGSGNTHVHRFTTLYKKNDYVYWSTPVNSTPITASVFTGGWRTNNAYEYNNNWVPASIMTPGKGYIIMVPDAGGVSHAHFRGQLNNGVYTIGGVSPSKSYLLGNPYPSAINADEFIVQNAGVIGGTLYFWTHATAIQLASDITNGTAGSGTYAYTSDDYASYNLTGGVGTGVGKGNKNTDSSKITVPTGKIASGQGFFTTSAASISGTSFVFNNSMRVSSGAGANSQFFKTKASNDKKTAAIEKHRIWLNLSNDEGAFKQTLLGYISGASNEVDKFFDGKTLDGNKFIDFYSVNQNNNLVIQGRALPFDDKDEVPLGYKTAVDGTFTINIEKADGVLENQEVFLEDKLTNTVFDLKSGDYTFATAQGTFNDRFVLKYTNKTLGTDDFDTASKDVLVLVKNKQIKISSAAETIDKVMIYDVSGKQVYKNERVNSNELTVANFMVSNQVLIVKTTLKNGVVVTDKIVF